MFETEPLLLKILSAHKITHKTCTIPPSFSIEPDKSFVIVSGFFLNEKKSVFHDNRGQDVGEVL